MKLIPVNHENSLLEECGYTNPINFDNPNFHGYQKGVAICIINKETGIIERNMLGLSNIPEERRDEYLKEILESKEIVKIVDDITQLENEKLVPKQIFYLPYIVGNHSIFKPTVNNDNISGASNVHYEIDVELLFVHDNLNRYMTIHFTTQNVSVMDCIYGLFDEEDTLKDELIAQGAHYLEKEDDEGNQGYGIDFYDEAGNRYVLYYPGAFGGERLRDDLVSMRVIDIKMEYDTDYEEETENPEH